MRLVATRRLEPGSTLARDVTIGRTRDRALLRAGVTVTDRYREALLANGHNAVYVEDDLSHDVVVTPALTEATRATATESLSRAFATVPAVARARDALPPEAMRELESVATMIAGEIAGSGQSVVALTDLAAADAYTLQHSIDVCAVGLLLAKRLFDEEGRVDFRGHRVFDRLEQWLAKLGVGLMLHDIGKVAIPTEVLNKPGKLDPDEWTLMRAHPGMGIELLSSDTISPLVKAVVRSHHERWDGGGYPSGIAGEAIPHFARIAAVADVFDAVTSERPYKAAARQHIGHEVINRGSGTQFDAEIVTYFNKVVAPYPPGDEIILADGRRGVVLSCPVENLSRPLVRIGFDAAGAPIEPQEINTLYQPDVLAARGRRHRRLSLGYRGGVLAEPPPAWVYLLRCCDGSLYCGWTSDLERRMRAHAAGRASRYTASRRPLALALALPQPDRSAARREEARVKGLAKGAKESWVAEMARVVPPSHDAALALEAQLADGGGREREAPAG
jgi:HD-GYP domain-containing protein (c-di-GMP phosphodiesterase class II)/predicted GIY-YIG superfamily endonuclease